MAASRSRWRASSTSPRPSRSTSTRVPTASGAAGRWNASTRPGAARSVRSPTASRRSRWSCRPAGPMCWRSGGAAGPERRRSRRKHLGSFSQEDRPMLSALARRVWAVLLAVGGLLGSATGVLAQNTISLHGRVTATDGKPLVAAQVAVLNRETGQQRSALTSAEGTYTIVGLPPGAYRVRLVLLGHRAQERDVELLVGQRASLDFELQEAAVAVEGVAVTHQREPVFEVQRNDVSTPVVSAEILNLPLNTRNTINLAAIVPGMKTFAPTAGRSLPAAGPLPDLRFWNFYLDGAEWKSFFNGNLVGIPQTGSPLPQEAMREFRGQLRGPEHRRRHHRRAGAAGHPTCHLGRLRRNLQGTDQEPHRRGAAHRAARRRPRARLRVGWSLLQQRDELRRHRRAQLWHQRQVLGPQRTAPGHLHTQLRDRQRALSERAVLEPQRVAARAGRHQGVSQHHLRHQHFPARSQGNVCPADRPRYLHPR